MTIISFCDLLWCHLPKPGTVYICIAQLTLSSPRVSRLFYRIIAGIIGLERYMSRPSNICISYIKRLHTICFKISASIMMFGPAVLIRPKDKWSHRSNRGRDTFNPRPLPESIAWDWGSLIFCLRWAALPEKMKWDERDQWQYRLDNHSSRLSNLLSISTPDIHALPSIPPFPNP